MTTIIRAREPLNCCGDTVRILGFDTGEHTTRYFRNYTLYRAGVYDNEKGYIGVDIFYIIMEGDEFPVVITKELAEAFLEDPEEGAHFAYNHWMCRHK